MENFINKEFSLAPSPVSSEEWKNKTEKHNMNMYQDQGSPSVDLELGYLQRQHSRKSANPRNCHFRSKLHHFHHNPS